MYSRNDTNGVDGCFSCTANLRPRPVTNQHVDSRSLINNHINGNGNSVYSPVYQQPAFPTKTFHHLGMNRSSNSNDPHLMQQIQYDYNIHRNQNSNDLHI